MGYHKAIMYSAPSYKHWDFVQAVRPIDHGTRKGLEVSSTPRPLFNLGKDTVPLVQEAGWAPEPVSMGAENLVPTGIRSPDRPARSQSLYRQSYPAYRILCNDTKIYRKSMYYRAGAIQLLH